MTDKQWEPPPAIVKASAIAFCVADGWEDPTLSIVDLGLERPIWKRHEHGVSAALSASPLPECVEVLRTARWVIAGDIEFKKGGIAHRQALKRIDALLAILEDKEPADEVL